LLKEEEEDSLEVDDHLEDSVEVVEEDGFL
jgi:hypothetical protein